MNTEHNPTDPEAALRELGLTLPEAAAPVASYVPTRRVGDLVFVSGQIPMHDGEAFATGSVPGEVSVGTAAKCAEVCALNGLAALKREIGDLSRVRSVVRLGGFVACGPGFREHPKIINGASELMLKVFGERGRHARAAVGCPSLPLNVPVEVEFVFEVE